MKITKFLMVAVVIVAVVAISTAFYGYQVVNTPNILVDKESELLFIPADATFDSVRDTLYEKDYVQNIVAFSFLAKLMNYDEQVKPGRYKLETSMTNLEAIRHLRSGRQQPLDITFNTIRTKPDLAGKITRNLMVDSTRFLQLLNNQEVASKYGFTRENFLTMFIPNTYEVYWTITAEELINRMHREYQRFWTEPRKDKAEKLGMSPVEVSILASIVDAETNQREEAPTVAGLYLNRLERNIALQADPTLVFAHQDFSIRRVLDKHKEIESPYNTYKYTGLPPGPIRLPDGPMIDAVLNYEDHNFLYMCAREDFSGYHNFATNLRDHLNNAARYQRALSQQGIYR